MYCTSCGRKREKEEKYCTSCGKKFEEDKDSTPKLEDEGPKVTSYQSEIPIILTGVLSLVLVLIPIVSIPLAITSICLGIAYKTKTHKFSIGPVLGIITIIITILFFISTLLFVPLARTITSEVEFPKIEERSGDQESQFNITDYNWTGTDNSSLTFENNSTFIWQKSQNTIEGKYQIYNGMEVMNYIASHLEEFGLTSEDRDEYFKKESSNLANYYLIILSTTDETTYLYGSIDEEKTKLSLKNIKTQEDLTFNIKGKKGSMDI